MGARCAAAPHQGAGAPAPLFLKRGVSIAGLMTQTVAAHLQHSARAGDVPKPWDLATRPLVGTLRKRIWYNTR